MNVLVFFFNMSLQARRKKFEFNKLFYWVFKKNPGSQSLRHVPVVFLMKVRGHVCVFAFFPDKCLPTSVIVILKTSKL